MKMVCNYEKALKMLGYKPKATLEGLTMTIQYTKEYPELYIHTKYLM